jgi:hypothetical protein
MAATAMVRTEARVENCILMELLVFWVLGKELRVLKIVFKMLLEDAVGRCC